MEEEEDEVPSLPLGVTGTLCSLFHACGKSQGLTLFFQSKLQFQMSFASQVFEYKL